MYSNLKFVSTSKAFNHETAAKAFLVDEDKWSKRTGRILAEFYLRIQYIRPLGSETTPGLHLSTSLELHLHLFSHPMCHQQSQRSSGHPFWKVSRKTAITSISCSIWPHKILAFALIPELIAQNARTLWVNVHSCTKLFNMLNILSSWHAWQKSQNMTPHTWGNSLRQQPRVTLSSADSSSVRRALRKVVIVAYCVTRLLKSPERSLPGKWNYLKNYFYPLDRNIYFQKLVQTSWHRIINMIDLYKN